MIPDKRRRGKTQEALLRRATLFNYMRGGGSEGTHLSKRKEPLQCRGKGEGGRARAFESKRGGRLSRTRVIKMTTDWGHREVKGRNLATDGFRSQKVAVAELRDKREKKRGVRSPRLTEVGIQGLSLLGNTIPEWQTQGKEGK